MADLNLPGAHDRVHHANLLLLGGVTLVVLIVTTPFDFFYLVFLVKRHEVTVA